MHEISRFFHFCKRNKADLVKHFQQHYLTHDLPFEDWGKEDMARFTEFCDSEFQRNKKKDVLVVEG
jgi:hypothetical protein